MDATTFTLIFTLYVVVFILHILVCLILNKQQKQINKLKEFNNIENKFINPPKRKAIKKENSPY